MFLTNIMTSIRRRYKKSIFNFSYFLAQQNEPTDNYREYLIHGDQPKDPFNNPRNLFDDSNSKDKKWLEITKEHLSTRR